MEDGVLFNIHEIANFDFTLHQQFYTALNQNGYTLLAKRLYEFNHGLRTLHNHILMLSGEAPPPLQVIWSLIIEFREGGETRTGQTFASINAQQAFTDFNAYLSSLPSQFRKQLFALNCWSELITFENIMRNLHNEGCVNTAADQLEKIVRDPANHTLLTSSPTLAPENIKEVIRSYKEGKTPLVMNADSTQFDFSPKRIKKIAQKIQITSEEELLKLLIVFPPAHYKYLLTPSNLAFEPNKNSVYISCSLGNMINSGALNPLQQRAYYEVLALNNSDLCIEFAAQVKSPFLLNAALQKLAPCMRVAKILADQTLAFIARDLASLECVIKLIPKDKLLSFLTVDKSDKGNTLVMHASYQFVCLEFIFEQISKLVNCNKSQLLPFVSSSSSAMWALLEGLNKSEKLEALSTRNNNLETVFHLAENNLIILNMLFFLLGKSSKSSKLDKILLSKDKYQRSPIDKAITHPEALNILLTALTRKMQRCVASSYLFQKDNLFKYAIGEPEILEILLSKLLSIERVKILTEIHDNVSGDTLLHKINRHHPRLLPVFLKLIPIDQRLNAMNIENRQGETISLLLIAARQQESIKTIRELLPEEHRQPFLDQPINTHFFQFHCFTSIKIITARMLLRYPISASALTCAAGGLITWGLFRNNAQTERMENMEQLSHYVR